MTQNYSHIRGARGKGTYIEKHIQNHQGKTREHNRLKMQGHKRKSRTCYDTVTEHKHIVRDV